MSGKTEKSRTLITVSYISLAMREMASSHIMCVLKHTSLYTHRRNNVKNENKVL